MKDVNINMEREGQQIEINQFLDQFFQATSELSDVRLHMRGLSF